MARVHRQTPVACLQGLVQSTDAAHLRHRKRLRKLVRHRKVQPRNAPIVHQNRLLQRVKRDTLAVCVEEQRRRHRHRRKHTDVRKLVLSLEHLVKAQGSREIQTMTDGHMRVRREEAQRGGAQRQPITQWVVRVAQGIHKRITKHRV